MTKVCLEVNGLSQTRHVDWNERVCIITMYYSISNTQLSTTSEDA